MLSVSSIAKITLPETTGGNNDILAVGLGRIALTQTELYHQSLSF